MKKRSILASLSLILISTSGIADEAKDHRINPGNVLGVVIGDWNKDGGMDRAVLVAPEDRDNDVGLYIYLEDDTNNSSLKIFKPSLAWSGAMWGTTPSLTFTPSGSLQVISQNQAIGRSRWSKKLTIAYRNDDFVVAGYTYDAFDTLEPDSELSCDVNLLTGKGIKNKKAFSTTAKTVKLADWTVESVPKECQEA